MTMPGQGHIPLMIFCISALAIVVHGQNEVGFISLDCGIPANSSYTDPNTTLTYHSDAPFIDAGVDKAIAAGNSGSSSLARHLLYLRTFPNGYRNCYNIPVTKGTKYLIRTTFYYGNYDGLNKLPIFDLHLGVNKWVTVQILNATRPMNEEIIYTPPINYIYVCLVNMGTGTPFVSALELRPLHNNTYSIFYQLPTEALAQFVRLDVGSISNRVVRYPDDVYDRIWVPQYSNLWSNTSTSLTVDANDHNNYQVPSLVMKSACSPANASEPMKFYFEDSGATKQFYVYLHFAEIMKLGPNQTRIFNITENNYTWNGPMHLDYLYTITAYNIFSLVNSRTHVFSLFKAGGSTLPPILNAAEIFYVVNLDQLQTVQADVDAISSVKSTYGITRNWQGDPCAPREYAWEGLNCNYSDGTQPIIKGLDLSSSGLVGSVSPMIGNLKSLESLDLSNNSFNGLLPKFLSKMTTLTFLDLSDNNFTGTLPADLYQRSRRGSLQLRVSGNPNLCPAVSCNTNTTTVGEEKKKKSSAAPVAGAVAGVLLLVAALAILVICLRRRKKSGSRGGNVEIIGGRSLQLLDAKKRQFNYSELNQMTNNFRKILGKGGFGTVYHGYLDGMPVAVKMLSGSSIQGFKEFQAEVKVLLRVHHRNLTTLVGYCDEDPNLGLIYEYMANGNLQDHLSVKNEDPLNWEGRLQVAVEAAQGLEYLHSGCKPPIVHRDVKSTNILLNDRFRAKLSDFGLSRVIPTEVGTHVSTIVAGTPGYLDPEYYITNWLTEKSDIYSFGVVLLEILTGQSVISSDGHLSQWVSSMVEKGDINQVVDPRLRRGFDANSVWKVAELALACLSTPPSKRPTMSQVVIELNESLAAETARTRQGFSTQSNDSIEHMSIQVHTGATPLVR